MCINHLTLQPASTSALETSVTHYSSSIYPGVNQIYAEDAPAPSALHSFKASVSEGKIYVTADPQNTTKQNMSRPPKLLATGTASSTGPGVVIVGGGSGAFHAVESLREVWRV